MWCRNVLLVLTFLHFDTITGEYNITKHHRLLCDVFEKAQKVLRLYGGNGNMTDSLKDAIYGTKSTALFEQGGKVIVNEECNKNSNGRDDFCKFHKGISYGRGCFAGSLVGTLMCLCTPGSNDAINVCGVAASQYGQKWVGSEKRSEQNAHLFQKVWEKVVRDCHGKNEDGKNSEEVLANLEKAAKAVQEKLEQRNVTSTDNSIYFYLGGDSKVTHCIGINGGDNYLNHAANGLCVQYQGEASTKNATIPWVEKIEETIKKLKGVKPVPVAYSVTYEKNGLSSGHSKGASDGFYYNTERGSEKHRPDHSTSRSEGGKRSALEFLEGYDYNKNGFEFVPLTSGSKTIMPLWLLFVTVIL
ncbi:Variant surface glycoprotein [Trypanosoma congolense IL3000]|uniref:Variant surface glycoprotein n=1 Tax=Trypanosoma congolense (strain IL3000) TaxID=1068625 RepID=F9W6J1_TRYCI|nr:Variant surface glycoprotein [Trypanosoma congolense IL3000]